jgi:hypothetical protein
MNEASGVYEPMLPAGWIGERPADHELARQPGAAIPARWRDVVLTRRLGCGVEVRVELRGFAVYDFANWPPGVARPPATGRIRTFADVSNAAKPALVQRLRLINSHLTLLHAAAMSCHDVSPSVMRVHERDLYRFDYPDDGGDGYWYRPYGELLPTDVTFGDRARFGTMPTATFELSLDWLDAVVATGTLIEFDLLNQTQAGLATHDYALAVVAGWTVCELRARALGAGVPGGNARDVSKVCDALEQHGMVSGSLAQRMGILRKRRNKWLHSGAEPDEQVALEALRLATELLRGVVPDRTTRAVHGMLLL